MNLESSMVEVSTEHMQRTNYACTYFCNYVPVSMWYLTAQCVLVHVKYIHTYVCTYLHTYLYMEQCIDMLISISYFIIYLFTVVHSYVGVHV